jgi:hypothetical protein
MTLFIFCSAHAFMMKALYKLICMSTEEISFFQFLFQLLTNQLIVKMALIDYGYH